MEEEVMNLKDIKIPIIGDIEMKKPSLARKKLSKALDNTETGIQIHNIIHQSNSNAKQKQKESDVKNDKTKQSKPVSVDRRSKREGGPKMQQKNETQNKDEAVSEVLPVVVTQTVEKVQKESRAKSKVKEQPIQKKEKSVHKGKKEDKTKQPKKEEIKTVTEVIESAKLDRLEKNSSAKSNSKAIKLVKESKAVIKEVKADKERTKSKAKIETSKRALSQKPHKVCLTKSQSPKVLTPRKTEMKAEPVEEIVDKNEKSKNLTKGPKAKREAKLEQKQAETKKSHSSKRVVSEQKIKKDSKNKLDIDIKPIEFVVEESVKNKHQSKDKQQKHTRNKSTKKVNEEQPKIAKSKDINEKRTKSVKKDKGQLNNQKVPKAKEQLLSGKKREHKNQDKEGIKRKKQDKSHKHNKCH